MTIKEIALLAGVSIGTIDRVLYHRGRVSPETQKKVEEILERYQFTPNPIARRLQRGKAYRFCTVIPFRYQDAGYWGQALRGIEEGRRELAPLGIETEVIEYDRYNPHSFKNAVSAVFERKPDGVVFAPIMPDKTRPFVARMQEQGIPYVFFDADIPEASPLSVIGHDSFKGGYLAGRLMHLFAGDRKGPFAVLDAHDEDYHITRRRDGFLSYAGEHGFGTVVYEYSGYRGIELPEEDVALFLRKNPDIAGLFITNCMTHRVAESAAAIKSRRDFTVIGYDLIPDNRRLLEDGYIDAIISQHPEEQGREALLNLYRSIVLQQKVPPRKAIPLDIYIKENIPSA